MISCTSKYYTIIVACCSISTERRQLETQHLFYYALRQVKSGKAPADENALEVSKAINVGIHLKTYLSDSYSILQLYPS